MAMDLNEIEALIKEALPDAVVEIQDLAGDGNHYSATVTSSQFSGKSKIEQHKITENVDSGGTIVSGNIVPDTDVAYNLGSPDKKFKVESVQPHPEVVKAYKKTLGAEDKAGDYNYRGNKARLTRSTNHLSKKIKQHHPDLDMKGNIALRTKLQSMKHEEAPGTATTSVAGAGSNPQGIVVVDRRRGPHRQPKLLKRFRKYIDD